MSKSIGILKVVCAVFSPGSSVAAILEDTTASAILPCLLISAKMFKASVTVNDLDSGATSQKKIYL